MKDIVFCDVDGTLVDCTRGILDISEKSSYALKQLKKKAYVFLVTGRPKCIIPKGIMECEPQGYVLSNGAYAELNGKVLYHEPITDLDHFRDYCDKTNNIYMFMNQEKCFVKDINDKISREFMISMSYPPEETLFPDNDVDYSDFVWLYSDTEEKRLDIEREFVPEYNINRQQVTTFDIVLGGVSKDKTVRIFLDNLDIEYNKTYFFGDGFNDIGMMKSCDISICMANGRDETKKVATMITDDIIDDGFYNALVKLNLIEPMSLLDK